MASLLPFLQKSTLQELFVSAFVFPIYMTIKVINFIFFYYLNLALTNCAFMYYHLGIFLSNLYGN
jgi:hypothetical protein